MSDESKQAQVARNTGHGHVFPRPDGVKARCGGPGICAECSRDAARAAPAVAVSSDGWKREGSLLYRLNDERAPSNRDEINVTMADGSRDAASRDRRACALLAMLGDGAVAMNAKAVPVAKLRELIARWERETNQPAKRPGRFVDRWHEGMSTAAADLGVLLDAVSPLMVDITPPATARDRWMYEQGRLVERDPRSHAATPGENAQPPQPYSLDMDPLGIRAKTADAITGALAFGAKGVRPPPKGHWLVPFWEMARADAAQPAQKSEPVGAKALSAMNNELCAFFMRWSLDGDYLRCKKCKRPHIASRIELPFNHESDCPAEVEGQQSPWLDLIRLLAPILPAAPQAAPAPPADADWFADLESLVTEHGVAVLDEGSLHLPFQLRRILQLGAALAASKQGGAA